MKGNSPMVYRYVAGAAAGAALAVSLTGCLGDGGKSKASGQATPGGTRLSVADALGKVSDESGTIKSFRATMSIKTSAAGQETQMGGDVAYQLKPQFGMTMNFSHMTVAGKATQGFQEILLGDAIYMKMPALAKQSGGKPWLKFSLSGLSAKSGIDVKNLLNQLQQANPAVNVKMLTASHDAHQVGTEKVGGVTTTHYRGTYSMQQALAKLDAEQRAQAQKSLGQAGLDTMVFDLWVDGGQLPRKMTIATPAQSKLQMETTMVYSGFNQPVSITPPPASQVTDGSKLGGGSPNAPA
ncbi:MAG: hypothetical protein JWR24_323 [Actinoallomurus sp.]|nr:hypothetical protein [Actinoallomurus sp.]